MPAPEQVVQAAVRQIEQGFAVFALAAGAKVPVTEHGFKNATTKPDWARAQLSAPPAGNYGITWPTDAPDRVVVFDLDDGGGASRPWQDRVLDLIAAHGPLPPTKSTTTPSGGRHAFYRWPADVEIPAGDELFGFTVRWPGRGYLVGPGSIVDGREYTEGTTHEIAELPRAWVDAAIAERPARRNGSAPAGEGLITIAAGGFELPERIPSGRRYATVRDYVASRYNAGLGLEELWDLVRTQVAPRFDVAKSDEDLRKDFDRVTSKLVERLGPPASSGRPAAVAATAVAAVADLEYAPLTDFDSRPIEWLWPSWLARGVVTLMDGNPGVSKSTIVADLVARITTGREWPDGQPMPAGASRRVLYVTTEDDPGRVLRPRIEAAGGDASRVLFVRSEVVFPSGAAAFGELVARVAGEGEGVAAVILDPLFSHVDATVRTVSDNEMRKGVMDPLADVAEASDIAILVIRHFNKDTKAGALNRGAGSLGGIVGAARALWTVTVDPEDETGDTKAVGVEKLNYARTPLPWRYRVVDRVPPGWVTGSVSGIEWLGEASVSVGTMLTEDDSTGDAVPILASFLRSKGGFAPSIEAYAHMKARGFGRDATRGAKRRLHVATAKIGMAGGWIWRLPDVEEAELTDPDVSSAPSGDPPELTVIVGGSDASAPSIRRVAPASARTRAGARAGGARSPNSSDSSGDSGALDGGSASDLTELTPDGAPPARAAGRAPARDEPVIASVEAALTERVDCHWFADHQSKHFRGPDGWRCEICSPLEETP